MTHIALYRTWRPQAFGEMVGQQFVTQTLQNSLREGRFSHAYLFSGPRGTGKTSAAKILAKAVNCEYGPAAEPCNQCSSCLRISEGTIMDVLEIDAASNRGVEEIRDIRDKVRFAPTEVRRKVYIIDEVHMLTTEAFNALLKTLEEPPAHVMFILATTEPHRLPATIISRCQRFDFKRITLQEQVARLHQVCMEEQIQIEEDALQHIARLSDGGMRDAISLLDQISSFSSGLITLEDVLTVSGGVASEQFEQLASAIHQNDIGRTLDLIDHWMQDGKSADKCLESMIVYFRDLLLVKMAPNSRNVMERIWNSASYQTIASEFTHHDLIGIIEVLNGFQTDLKFAAQPQTLLEVAVMKVCGLMSAPAPSSVKEIRQQDVSQSSVTVANDSDFVLQMKNRLELLEQQVTQLNQLIQLNSRNQEMASGAGPKPAPSSPSAKPLPQRHSGIKLDRFLGCNEDSLKPILMNWGQLLSRVKEKKITVHAWLVDGEPVAVGQDEVLVAFKSAMHRETTEKPTHKQLIEQTLSEVFGQQLRLVTVMIREWQEARQNAGAGQEQQSHQQIGNNDHKEISANPEWVDAAIKLFGENLVKIKEE